MKRAGLFLALVISCAACSDKSENNVGAPDVGVDSGGVDAQTEVDWGVGITYHGDIQPLIQDNCLPCHGAGGAGPYDLTEYDTVVELAPLIKDSVQSRTMPPWSVDNSGTCNKYKDARWLADDEIAMLVDWLDGDQAVGNPEWAPDVYVPAVGLPRVDLSFDIGVEYTPKNSPDDYRCFVVDPGLEAGKFITGFDVRPGNLDTVHHVILFDMEDDENVAFVEALDAADPEPGYECFGGPGTAGFNLYAAWVPGSPATVFPEPTGLELPAGRKVVVQVHYNTLAGSGPDRTAIDLMLADTVGMQTLMVLFANTTMALPGGGMDAETVFDIQTRQFGVPFGVTIHGVLPHMHKKGRSMTVTHITDDGGTCAVNVPKWDFDWQQIFFFDQPLLVLPDDLLRLSCKYDLTDDVGMVPWGDGTADEMCVAILYATIGAYPDSVRPAEVGDAVEIPVSVPDTSNVDHVWSKRVGGINSDTTGQLAIDEQGDLWVAGRIQGGDVDVEGTILDASSPTAMLAKYSADGTILWARSYGEAGWSAVASDGQGGAFLGGQHQRVWDLGGTVHPTPPLGLDNAVIARVDANGDLLWSRSFGGDGWDWIGWRGAAVDSAGNFIATGQVDGVVDVFGTQLGAVDRRSRFMLKLDPDGTMLWATTVCSTDQECHIAPTVGPNDDIVLGGLTSGTTQFYGGSEHVAIGLADEGLVTREDGFLMGIAADGSFQWVKTFGGELADGFAQANFDESGDLYAVGFITGAVELGTGPVQFSGSRDALIGKFDPTSGDVIWSKSLGGLGYDSGGDLTFDGSGNLIIGLEFGGWVDFGSGLMVSEGRADMALVSLTTDGDFRWAKAMGGRGRDYRPRLVADDTAVYLGMFSSHGLNVGGDDLDGHGGDDIVLAKFALP